ncbi:uncharacterized protein LOC132067641 [Lycium ferocissimum]|uniref:uncharacterized protein LOC132067641 n=1 Tax=Lycium ferocissimum TaxID=112874 RepID=UPI00281623DA|nr:uncharacterized protein LOC132067641 [Lycium ferocissimum]
MASDLQKSFEEDCSLPETAYGAEECYRRTIELLKDLGFPKGVLPLKDLEEFGYVRKTGFEWMKQKASYEHYFTSIKMPISYATEVTAYVEKGRMKKISGVKGKQLLLWVPATEMSINSDGKKLYFRTPVGLGRSYPITAFMTDEEKQKYIHGES